MKLLSKTPSHTEMLTEMGDFLKLTQLAEKPVTNTEG